MPLSSFKAVFFDVGGTLIRVHPSVGDVYARYARAFGYSGSVKVLNEGFHAQWKKMGGIESLGNQSGPKVERDFWHKLVYEVFQPLGGLDRFEEYFDLIFEVKVDDKLNSGVQIRSQTKGGPKGRVNGPQVEIEASGKNGAEAGYIYGEAAGGWMTPADKLKPHKHFKDGKWNKYRVVADGANIKVWINGAVVSDLNHEEKYKSHPKGFIGLQVHSIGRGSGPYEVRWRKIKIKELD